jgi:hypothetical protein
MRDVLIPAVIAPTTFATVHSEQTVGLSCVVSHDVFAVAGSVFQNGRASRAFNVRNS